MDLFPQPHEPSTETPDVPWTVDLGIRTFLYRWFWRGDRRVVEQELRELIERAKQG